MKQILPRPASSIPIIFKPFLFLDLFLFFFDGDKMLSAIRFSASRSRETAIFKVMRDAKLGSRVEVTEMRLQYCVSIVLSLSLATLHFLQNKNLIKLKDCYQIVYQLVSLMIFSHLLQYLVSYQFHTLLVIIYSHQKQPLFND